MRSLVLATTVVLLGLVPARADLLEVTYSGVVGTNLGVLHTGDIVSGMVVWDSKNFSTNACPGSPAFAICLPLITDNLNVSGGSGLWIPGGTVLFAGIPEVTAEIQIKEQSPVDLNFYSFFVFPTVGTAGVTEFVPTGSVLGSINLTSAKTTGPSALLTDEKGA